DGFLAHRYWSRLKLNAKAPITSLEITNVCRRASITIFKVTAYDAARNDCMLLAQELPGQWRATYDREDARIYENRRAMPRAWLVGHAEATNEQDALRRIRGEDERPFDPRRTALLEIPPDRLPRELREAANEASDPAAQARIVNYEPNRLAIETASDK